MFTPSFEALRIDELQPLLPAYEILDFIAQGGMGAVYRARQVSLDREVAIKVLPREFGADAGFREKFAAEAKAMARLNHPNLIAVYDCGEVAGVPYIVMEYVHGKSLHHSAHGQCIEPSEAAMLVLGICEGLAHAHEGGILHRDIKPANILLDAHKHPKVGDFGLACTIDSGSGSPMDFGTPGYSAPEVFHSPDKVDKRSDVYSIGVLFHQLLTSELPAEPYAGLSRRLAVDPAIDRFLRRALHPSPALRFPDAGAMAAELGRLVPRLSKPRTVAFAASPRPPIPGALPAARVAGVRPMPRVSTVGTNWPLVRNLVIIALLLVAIFVAHGELRKRQRLVEVAQLTVDPPQVPGTPGAPKAPTPQPRPEPALPESPPEAEAETPLQALARLRGALARGERAALPPGTLGRGDARYFLVDTPMAWQDAAAFAEQHGGFLATASRTGVADLLSARIPDEQVAWLGGGPTGRGAWGWVDGSEWVGRVPFSGDGAHAALTGVGVLKFREGGEKHPFFIQWHMDGSNPGSLIAQLQRTRDSLANPTPTYPPGTVSFDSRHYLVVKRAVSWDDADSIARAGDGHLAVPSDKPESEFIRGILGGVAGEASTCWIGMQRRDGSFAWTTGEAWHFAEWAPGYPQADIPTGSVGRQLAGAAGGWQHTLEAERSEAFIIEWSADHTSRPAAGGNVADEELRTLRQKADDAIRKANLKHGKDVRTNTNGMAFELRDWMRGQAQGVQNAWQPAVARILDGVDEDGRLHQPRDGKAKLHDEIRKIVNYRIDKQNELDAKLQAKLDGLRQHYLRHLAAAGEELRAKGLEGGARRITGEISACGSTDGFLRHFDFQPIAEPLSLMEAAARGD